MFTKVENINISSRLLVFLWAFKMQRRQLKIRIGTQLIMPSGKAAKCLKIDGDEFTFQYLQGWGKFVLSRNAIISMMPEQVA